MECEMQENEVGHTKHLNLYQLKTYVGMGQISTK